MEVGAMKLIWASSHNSRRVAIAGAALLWCVWSAWLGCHDASGQLVLSGGGLTLLEEGGSFAPGNVARIPDASPIAIDELGFGLHRTVHLNDGRYGNSFSWISDGGLNAHGVAFAGISFGEILAPHVDQFAFGRDNTGVFWDRSYPGIPTPGQALYTLQYTQVPNPHLDLDLPDDTAVPGTTAMDGWATIGTLDYQGPGGPNFGEPALRHLYAFDPVDATGLRLLMPSPIDCCPAGPIGGGRPAIDEIEIYGAEFRNLDFEQAVITFEPPDQVPNGFTTVLAADALPYWTTNGALNDPSVIGYNSTCLGAGCTSIHDSGSMFSEPPLEGEYTPHLLGPKLDPPDEGPLYLAQVGLVPLGATRLMMLANQVGNDPFFVTFDDGSGPQVLTQLQPVTPFPLGQTVWLVFDISPFTGQIGELKINSDAHFESWVYVDDLEFIPEPSTLLLALIALGVVGGWRKWKRAT
jgi:hypothetical protein